VQHHLKDNPPETACNMVMQITKTSYLRNHSMQTNLCMVFSCALLSFFLLQSNTSFHQSFMRIHSHTDRTQPQQTMPATALSALRKGDVDMPVHTALLRPVRGVQRQNTPALQPRQEAASYMLTEPIAKTLWSFALPLMFSFVVNTLYSWIDTYFVSHLGAAALAAIGIGEQLHYFMFTLCSGFTVGTGIIIARTIGEHNHREAARVAVQGLMGMAVLSLVMLLVLQSVIDDILFMVGVRGQTFVFATEYLHALLLGIPGSFLLFQLNVSLRSTGNSRFAMITLLSSTLLNALFAPCLVFGVWGIPALGMKGAGLATALAQLISAGIGFALLLSGRMGLRLPRRVPSLDVATLRAIVRLGLPSSAQFLAVSTTRMGLVALANAFGTSVAAAYTIGLKIDFFVFMPIFAIGIALETTTGQNLGAGKLTRVFEFWQTAMKQLLTIIGVLGIAVFFGGSYFARLFTHDPNVIHLAASYMRVAAFCYPFFVIAIVCSRVISGSGDAVRSMLIIAGGSVGMQLPAALLLARLTPLAEQGIWLGVLVGYMGMALLSFSNFQRRTWLKARL
jgi:putative MATE family efflux protein